MPNLNRPEPLKTIQPGDPWTFLGCTDATLQQVRDIGIGNVMDWVAPTEHQPRQFKIVAIHDSLKAIECTYVGWIEA